jgi:type IV pilus assembly protein PilB
MADAKKGSSIKEQNKKLFDYLVSLNILDEQALRLDYARATENKLLLEDTVADHEALSRKLLAKLLGDFHNMPSVYLAETSIDDAVMTLLPKEFAVGQELVLFAKDEQQAKVAVHRPQLGAVATILEKKLGVPIQLYYAVKQDIRDALLKYNKDAGQVFAAIVEQYAQELETNTSTEPPIIKIVETIITYAYENKASDIHIEPTDDYSLVRFRIDGILHDIVKLPIELHAPLVTRIKVMANLRTDEHQTSQDSKILFETKYEELDLRVSIVPITKGENIVMRLLSERSRQTSLGELGFSDADLERVRDAYKKSHGMILSTGPTGSGKTTTLYSILKLLNRRDINIMTIEDPVEYEIENINQIQVNVKTDLTFAKGLRSIVRQDPDIILVGEIRDEETASIAVNAAMTGHLVLSTLHTNDAATTFPRLSDMEVEDYLIGSSVSVVVAQRLVRKICVSCRVSETIDVASLSKDIQHHFADSKQVRVYKGKGCAVCHDTGYRGRIGLFEVMFVDEEIKEAIEQQQNASQIKKIAIKNGMTTMLEDGISKVKQGITTFEEVLRVTSE